MKLRKKINRVGPSNLMMTQRLRIRLCSDVEGAAGAGGK
jgi:hypothetical protein